MTPTRDKGKGSLRGHLRRLAAALASLVYAANNEAAYLSREAVSALSRDRGLQLPEQPIADRLGAWLMGLTMLDVGDGGGRTTSHFAPVVASCVAVDYSAPMIAACEAQFSGRMDNVSFEVADARNLSKFDSGSFQLQRAQRRGS